MEDLFNKLKALGLKVEKAADIEAEAEEEQGLLLEKAVSGVWLDELTRGVYRVEKEIALNSSYGRVALAPPATLGHLEQFGELKTPLVPRKVLFLDTETSSLSTGAGSFVFMIGVAYFTKTSLKIEQIFLEKPECELEFLCYFDDLLKDFDTFATYNGKAFDIPMLRNRFILARLPVSFNQYAHLDLLHLARRIWKLRLESRRLAEIEKEILALSRTEDEIPSWLVPQIYFDYLESRDAAPLKGVFYHNEMDLASLAALFIHINQLLENSTTQKDADGRDAYSIGNAFIKMGKWDLSRDFLKTGMQQGLPDDLQKEAARGFAHTLKKQGQWEEAIKYWEFAAGLGDYTACIELAKYYEHRQYDCQNALKWMEIASEMGGDPNYDQPSLDLRRKRLYMKEKKSEMNHER